MNKIFRLAILICAIVTLSNVAHAQEKNSATRGEMLYSARCNVCHTTQIHWRDKNLVTDWASLLVQVRRWQSLLELGWSEDEIKDVAHYLNVTFYVYKNTARDSSLD